MKREYVISEMEIVEFDTEDIITNSENSTEGNEDQDNGEE